MQEIEFDLDKEGRRPFLPTPKGGGFRAEESVMYSAAGFWDNQRKEWRRRYFIPQALRRWLDCGGFTLLNKFGDYPFSPMAFLNLVVRLMPHWYATLDYPCEPDIARASHLETNAQRIRATVENARKMLYWSEMVEGPICVPVIQGYTLSGYKMCIDLHEKAGNIRPYMAVGSMCRRISSADLHRLVPGIYEHARQAGAERLHFFGLKLSPDLEDLREFIWSRDSAVALDAYDPELRAARNGRRWPRGQEEKKAAFFSFLGRVEGDLGLEMVRYRRDWWELVDEFGLDPRDAMCLANPREDDVDEGIYGHLLEEAAYAELGLGEEVCVF
jgi:hypothetical protein